MRKLVSKWKCVGLFLFLLSALCLFGSAKSVSADTQNCRVIFTNAKGQVSGEYYRKLARTVEKGTEIELPVVNRSGYKAVWETKINGKQYKYSGGRTVTINQNTKFSLNYYKLYTVRFYTANGKKEYTSLRQTIVSGYKVTMPTGGSNDNYKFTGWAKKVGGSVYKKKGATVKVTSNLKFYAVQEKITGVRLCKYDGSFWKTVNNNNGKATFPAVNLNSGNMCLGWSRTKGKNTLSDSDYKAGDKIPSKSGKYYMVIFGTSMDRAPSVITSPTKFDSVFWVGDSRTYYMKKALGVSAPSNVQFVAKVGEGLSWFKSSGYKKLLRGVASKPKTETKAVIINLGVNDLKNVNEYVKYMKKVSSNLKKYNCKMYYLSVNPVNSAMIKASGSRIRTEAQVTKFNSTIYKNLCTGKNKSFTYINTCTNLQKKGWISYHPIDGSDGLHYSDATYLRIFDYCMRYLNR